SRDDQRIGKHTSGCVYENISKEDWHLDHYATWGRPTLMNCLSGRRQNLMEPWKRWELASDGHENLILTVSPVGSQMHKREDRRTGYEDGAPLFTVVWTFCGDS
ncbi:hypothetical protein STEG23_019920, partial [Scotinomys teguina]